MKKLFITCLIAFLFIGIQSVSAANLICDPTIGITAYQIEVDGIVVEAAFPAEPDGSVRWNVDHLLVGDHVFRIAAIGEGGWPGFYSVPLEATKPGVVSGIRISQ